jgi:hypothetical protein
MALSVAVQVAQLVHVVRIVHAQQERVVKMEHVNRSVHQERVVQVAHVHQAKIAKMANANQSVYQDHVARIVHVHQVKIVKMANAYLRNLIAKKMKLNVAKNAVKHLERVLKCVVNHLMEVHAQVALVEERVLEHVVP